MIVYRHGKVQSARGRQQDARAVDVAVIARVRSRA